MQETTFEKERSVISQGDFFVVGIDEVGRGPLAGPVVAAAVCYRDQNFALPLGLEQEFALMRDSKKLSEKQRERIFSVIEKYFHVGIGMVGAETIDRINILQATFLAMKASLTAVTKKLPSGKAVYLLIDGNQALPSFSGHQEAIIDGDARVKSIAAASIIAKVTRDRLCADYEREYPGYGFGKHKGYGTLEHMNALRKYGPSPIHRLSFKPVLLSIPENVNKRFSSVLKPKKG